MSAPRRRETIEVTIPVAEIRRAYRNAQAIKQLDRMLERDNQRIRAHLSLRENLSIGVATLALCAAFSGASLAIGKDEKPDAPLGGIAAGFGILGLTFCRKAWNARPDRLPLSTEDRLKLEREYAGRAKKYDAFLDRNLGEALPFLRNE